jgi:membrane carboxypeptidase/penicillin-binding protein PbpC
MFRMKGAYLTNEKGKVMWVQGDADVEQRYIYSKTRKNHVSQQWDIIYADQWKRDPRKGELNRRFGIYVDRTFSVVSQLGSRRYLDIIGRGFVIKTSNGRKTQHWYFHQQSLTIRTRSNNQSWDIKSSGKTSDMQVWSTNSGWW